MFVENKNKLHATTNVSKCCKLSSRLLLVPWLWTSQFENKSYQVNLPEKLPSFSCYNAFFCSFYFCWTRVLNDEILKQGLITYWPCLIAWIWFLIFMIFVSVKVKRVLSSVFQMFTDMLPVLLAFNGNFWQLTIE